MTILTETRWKCDYCGNVSPALSDGDAAMGLMPMGWRVIDPKTHPVQLKGLCYPSPGWAVDLAPNLTPFHFCTEAHKQAWLKEREAA